MLRLLRQKFPPSVDLQLDGRLVPVTVKASARARHYRLSIPHVGGPVLTVPQHARWSEAEAFLVRHASWLAARLKRAPDIVSFAAGATIPLRGVPHRVAGSGKVRGRVEIEEREGEPTLVVPGTPEHHARRLTDWLKAEAELDLQGRVAVHAANLGATVKSLCLRSQSSRWGSCSSSGRLNFNWRLILAPPFVLDYVAAHEVAHLLEMNHSKAFWSTVKRTCPDMDRGRAWLKVHGSELMAYGR